MTTRQDLTIRQGETWSFTWTKLDSAGAAVDLNGYSARMKIKDGYNGIAQASLTDGSDTDGGTITLGGAAGTVVLAMTDLETAALASELSGASVLLTSQNLAEPRAEYLYDLELIDGSGDVTRELEGRIIIRREITT